MEEKLLTLINREWTCPALDGVMAAMSSINFWAVPLIMLIAAVAIWGGFRARTMLLVLGITIFVSDFLIGNTLKHLVGRPRPNEALANVRIVSLNLRNPVPRLEALFSPTQKAGGSTPWVRVMTSRPDPNVVSGRSFPSDHALNNFCAAMVIAVFYRRLGWLTFIPATVVAYSRVYVGSHWPSDIAISIVMALGLSLILLALYEATWRKLGARVLPRVYARHPGLWQTA